MSNDVVKEREAPVKKISGFYEGIPYKGAPLYLKDTDDISRKLTLHRVLKVERFDLGAEKDLKAYENVCQSIQEGHAQLSFEDREYVPSEKHWVVLLRWVNWWYSPTEKEK